MDELPQVGKRTLEIVSQTNRHSERLLAKAFERLAANRLAQAGRKLSVHTVDQPIVETSQCKEACT